MSNILEILKNRTYVSLSSITDSLSSSVSSSFDNGFLNSRLKVSNLLNKDLIFPIEYKNLSESVYFGSAYLRTKTGLANIIDNYPIGLSGSTTANLYLEDIENSNNFISGLSDYDWWIFRQLCGETLTSSTISFTSTATAIAKSLSATITSASQTYVVPIINRDAFNFVKFPQGIGSKISLDSYFDDLLSQSSDTTLENLPDITPFEQILTTSIAFDQGINQTLRTDWSGTASENFEFVMYDGIVDSKVVPDVFTNRINRSVNFQKSIPLVYTKDDYQDVMGRVLESMAQMFDDVKIYIDGMKYLFKNYWKVFDKLPKGYIQQLVAHQYGIDLFSSENRIIEDNLNIRGTYKTQKQITFEFWNRMLCSLMYILKTKGTIESIRASARSYGFTPGFFEIYELEDYISHIDGFYGDQRNYAVAKFRRESLDNKKYFSSITASTNSLSSLSFNTFTVHLKTRFLFNLPNASASGLSGYLFSISPSSYATYNCLIDYSNTSSSGFPFVSFNFTFGNSSLTTNYSFIELAQRQSVDGFWNLFFTKDINGLHISNGFLLSNYDYYSPVISTVSSSVGSYSAIGFTATSVTLGSTSNANGLWANVSNFYINKNSFNSGFLNDVVLDSGFLNTSSGYQNNLLAWKLNEYVDFAESGKNYILDSSTGSITGSPSFYGSVGVPYDYVYDGPTFYNDDIPGFKERKLDVTSDDALIKSDNKDKRNLRIGISLASPIDSFIHSMFGSNFGELYAHPLDYYSKTGDGKASYSYTLANNKTNELFSLIGNSRSSIYISEFLKFINRINGHISSFFSFIDQIIPVNKTLLEKGIIIENPINQRLVLSKTFIRNSGNLVQEKILTIDELTTISKDNVSKHTLDILVSNNLNTQNQLETKINTPFQFAISNQGISLTKTIGASTSSSFINNIPVYTKTIESNISERLESVRSLTTELNEYKSSNTISQIDNPIIEYIPRSLLQNNFKTYYYDVFKKHPLTNRIFIDAIPPIETDFTLNIKLDSQKILLSTTLSATDEQKHITGLIYIQDKYGRNISTDFDAIEVDLTDCLLSGYNRFRFIADGKDTEFSNHIFKIPIKNKAGIQFEISTKGSMNEGINSNDKSIIYFTNLLNTKATQKAVELYFGYSMENFSDFTGTSLTKGN